MGIGWDSIGNFCDCDHSVIHVLGRQDWIGYGRKAGRKEGLLLE
jgi:hypothetical protein